uniref:Uncharacterized protein n=1 Tax=Neolamprologus brichardi TaxID=32507 RepID=A0A3Q4HCN6_NEOBR
MDSSPILRQQSQNKIRTSHLSNKNIENKDPGSSATGKKAPLRAGISRLPVLAKSLHLQTPSDFSQSHCRWEEKPLARKAPKKKPLTRPVPFNLSQPKSTRTAAENQPLAVPKLRTHANTKPSKHPTALNGNKDSTKAAGKPLGKTTEDASHLPGPTGPSSTFQTSSLSTAMSSLPDSAVFPSLLKIHGNPFILSSENKDIKRVSLGLFFFCIIEKGENFQPDHAALLSILRNEGVGVTVLHLHHIISMIVVCTVLTGSVKSVQFSPDPAALQSILQNEGVKAGGPVGTTPRSSVCPPSRATSIYTAQRVPVRKNRPEATAAPTALNKWTPQRVRNTRHQPLSAMVSMYLMYVGTLSGGQVRMVDLGLIFTLPFIQAADIYFIFFPVTDLVGQKTCSVSSAVLMLRKRFPPLEELRLDEEVATYTSASVRAPPGFAPLRPSCGNPLASILHFEESTVSVALTICSGGPRVLLYDSWTRAKVQP